MKIIKLDRRHNLYHKGYRYAFLLDGWNWNYKFLKIEQAVKELEGWYVDNTFRGKKRGSRKPYYIGVKNELTTVMAMLKI